MADDVEVVIADVRPCECPSHARVVLRDDAGQRKLQVRIHADAGQALLAEMAGMVSPRGALVDLLRDAVQAAGWALSRVTLCCRGGRLCARLMLVGADGWNEVDAEPCEALVAACRMKLPVFVDETSDDGELPEVFREFVATLDMSGLEGPVRDGR